MAVKTSTMKRKISAIEDGGKFVSDPVPNPVSIPSVKDLASSEPQVRRHAFQKIISHLKDRLASEPLTLTQCEQLWRGFHVALYMHDSKNAISVQNLISDMAKTFSIINQKDRTTSKETNENGQPSASITTLSPHSKKHKTSEGDEADFNGFDDEPSQVTQPSTQIGEGQSEATWLSVYARGFWQTVIREWASIDSHRMNKYLLLVRLVVRELFTICLQIWTTGLEEGAGQQQTQEQQIQQISNLIQAQTTFLPIHATKIRDPKISNGLKLHILDIYVDELERVLNDHVKSNTGTSGGDKDEDEGDDEDEDADADEDADEDEKDSIDAAQNSLSPSLLQTFKQPLQDLAGPGSNKGISIDRYLRRKCQAEIQEYDVRILKV